MAKFGELSYFSGVYGEQPASDSPVTALPGTTTVDTPTKEWYYREKPGAELFGPIPYGHAEMAARRLSKDPDRSGQAELLTTVGDRVGDPVQPGGPRFVVAYIYLRGKKTFGGRQAVIQSNKNIV